MKLSSLDNTIVLYIHNYFHRVWKANMNTNAYCIQYAMSVFLKKLFLCTVAFLPFKNSHSIRSHLNHSKDVKSCHILKDQQRKKCDSYHSNSLCQLNIFFRANLDL